MSGKLIGIFIVLTSLIAGVSIYYLQVYAFYRELEPEAVEVRLTSLITGMPEPILADDLRAIDADSSPLRFRACFTTESSLAALTEEFVIYEDAEPLIAPDWFDCYDATAVAHGIEDGAAVAFLGEAEVRDGVDRVVAIFEDGRGFAWHQLNDTYGE